MYSTVFVVAQETKNPDKETLFPLGICALIFRIRLIKLARQTEYLFRYYKYNNKLLL